MIVREWLGFVLALLASPLIVLDELAQRRKYEALKAAERRKRVEEGTGL